MATPDWQEFKEWFKWKEGIDRANLNGLKLAKQYRFFSLEKYSEKFVSRINDENNRFLEDMKKRPPEEIIRSAYEIVIKEQIAMFVSEVLQVIDENKVDALLSSKNTLDEIYKEWIENDSFADTDIEVIVDNTADKIIAAKEREQKLAAELAKRSAHSEDMQDKSNRRTRR